MKLLCCLGLHKKIEEIEMVTDDTSNVKEYCTRCGKIFDEYGITHFHIGTFVMTKEEFDEIQTKKR